MILILDGAGWHSGYQVRMPAHLHRLFLPTHAPELRPCEHLCHFLGAPLVNRHFRNLTELEDVQLARCAAVAPRPHPLRTLFPWWPQRIYK